MAYNFQTALQKIGRVIKSGRGEKYFNRAKGLFDDIAKDYSTPSMGKKRRRKSGKRRRRR